MLFTKILMSIYKNLFDKNQPIVSQTYLNQDDTLSTDNSWVTTGYIEVDGTEFVLIRDNNTGDKPCIIGYDLNKQKITYSEYNSKKDVTLTSNTEISYIRFSIHVTENIDNIKLQKVK